MPLKTRAARYGTRKSGHCIDEMQALDMDQHQRAVRLHNACKYPGCTCTHHQGEAK